MGSSICIPMPCSLVKSDIMGFPVLKFVLRGLTLGSFLFLLISFPKWLLSLQYSQRISTPQDAASKEYAIVFGAGLRRDGQPTTVLADRVVTAVSLYQSGQVEKILMTGSSQDEFYNEARAMKQLAQELGVPPEEILIDPYGDRTFTSCRNAVEQFQIGDAFLITQRFHLPRALILCDVLGLNAAGVAADQRDYRAQSFWSVRETIATLRALWDAGQYWIAAS